MSQIFHINPYTNVFQIFHDESIDSMGIFTISIKANNKFYGALEGVWTQKSDAEIIKSHAEITEKAEIFNLSEVAF